MGKSRYNNLLTITTLVGDSKRVKFFKHKRHMAYVTWIYLFSKPRRFTMGPVIHVYGIGAIEHNASLIGLPYGCLCVCNSTLHPQAHSWESAMALFVTK